MGKPKESIRYKRMLRNIPTSDSLREAALKAGYADSTANSNIYNMSNKIKQDLKALGYSKEALKVEFERIAELCETKEDYSNLLRALENIQKYHLRDNAGSIAIFNLTSKDQEDALKVIQGEVLDSA
jgi:hypothetical protein